jgi:hypothetical protein
VGYADPALYRAAGTAYAADFNDVTTGNNDFTGTNDGRYAAAAGYDPVTGLGTPNASALAVALCAGSVRLSAPASERTTVHTAVTVRFRATDVPGRAVSYTASGLPAGLRVNPATGTVSGRPSRAGRFTARIAAHDGEGSTASVEIVWTVGAAPAVSRLSLTPTPRGPELVFTVSAGRNAPALQRLTITVPRYLRVASRRGIGVSTAAAKPARIRFTDRVTRQTSLTITLRQPAMRLRVTLAPPSLRAAGTQTALLETGDRVSLSLSVTDVNSGQSRLTPKVTVAR